MGWTYQSPSPPYKQQVDCAPVLRSHGGPRVGVLNRLAFVFVCFVGCGSSCWLGSWSWSWAVWALLDDDPLRRQMVDAAARLAAAESQVLDQVLTALAPYIAGAQPATRPSEPHART